jgi:DNA-binding Lrp family transcriptional regulator
MRLAAGRKRDLPYAAPPHDLVADPRLTPTDVRVAAALLYWTRSKAVCWPSDATIGRRVGRSPGTVQRSLRRLQAAGWIRREKTTANRTGRLIVLTWRSAGARPIPSPVIEPPAAPARDELNRTVEGDGSKEGRGDRLERPRPERPGHDRSGPSPVRDRPWSVSAEQKAAWRGSDDPILRAEAARRLAPPVSRVEPKGTVSDLLACIRASPANVAAAAELLAQDLGDRKSWNGFYAACKRAWEGEIPAEALVIAHREATNGRARSPGALFMAVLKREARGGG